MSALLQTLDRFLRLEDGRLIDKNTDVNVFRKKAPLPPGLETISYEKAAWILYTGSEPVGKVILVQDDILNVFNPKNMIDTGTLRYATGAPVPEELYDVYGLDATSASLFDDKASNRPKSNRRLPVGITLHKDKFRFRRSSKGLERDELYDTYEEAERAATEYERELAYVTKRIKEDEEKLKSQSPVKNLKNIYQRGNQYYVEFVINKKLLPVLKTKDLNEAIEMRDRFVKERRSALANAKQQERLQLTSQYMSILEEGLLDLNYEKIKLAVNFLDQREFDRAVESIDPPIKRD